MPNVYTVHNQHQHLCRAIAVPSFSLSNTQQQLHHLHLHFDYSLKQMNCRHHTVSDHRPLPLSRLSKLQQASKVLRGSIRIQSNSRCIIVNILHRLVFLARSSAFLQLCPRVMHGTPTAKEINTIRKSTT